MSRFTLELKTTLHLPEGRFSRGETVTLNLPVTATTNTLLTNPDLRNSIMSQFKAQGMTISPNMLGNGYWKVTEIQK